MVEGLVKESKIEEAPELVVMGHGVGPCIGPNEIKSPSPMTNFITINYLFNFIFGFIR